MSQETNDPTAVATQPPNRPAQAHSDAPPWNPAHFARQDPRAKSPLLAAFLSLVPGLGQIYVGYYRRGFVNPFVVGGVLSVLVLAGDESAPPFYFPLGVIFLVFFWLYNIIDAWRRASMYNLALGGIETIQLPDDGAGPGIGGSLFGGAMLVIVGIVILAHTKFGMPVEVIQEWWPLVPIAFGGFLMVRAYQDKRTE